MTRTDAAKALVIAALSVVAGAGFFYGASWSVGFVSHASGGTGLDWGLVWEYALWLPIMSGACLGGSLVMVRCLRKWRWLQPGGWGGAKSVTVAVLANVSGAAFTFGGSWFTGFVYDALESDTPTLDLLLDYSLWLIVAYGVTAAFSLVMIGCLRKWRRL